MSNPSNAYIVPLVRAGDALDGLWYPVGMLRLASIVGLLFLPETKDVDK